MDNPIARINLDNIKHNIVQIKTQVKNAKVMAVIKADAYGHGAVKIAQMLEHDTNVQGFAVARFKEALNLYNYNVTKPILLLAGVLDAEQLKLCARFNIWIAVYDMAQLKLIRETKLSKPVTLWLKFNTGMNRLGFNPDECDEVMSQVELLEKDQKISRECVLMSHLSCSDDLKNDFTDRQLALFDQIANNFKKRLANITFLSSMASSAGIFGWPATHYDWVRPGISLYGASAILTKNRREFNLKPSMSLISKIISVKQIKKDEKVGYGATWIANADTMIAIIACGYADCYPREGCNGYVYLKGKLCKIIGRVSMDTIAIDCAAFTELESANIIKIGDEVELWGSNINIDDVAKNCNTISYEIYTRVGARVEKEYV